MKGQSRTSIGTTSALAEALGISRWTVSRSLNGGSGVSEKTANRVKEAAREHGFRPSTLARGLRAGQTDVVGICLPDPDSYFLGGKLGHLLKAIFERGLEPLLQVTDGTIPSEENALGRFAAMRCPKVVTFASRLEAKHPAFRALEAAGTRTVHVDPIASAAGPHVMADRVEAMWMAVRHLHENGHLRFCVAGLDEGSAYTTQRRQGLSRAARQFGLDESRDFLFLSSPEESNDFETGEHLAQAWLRRARPRAIIALNDRLAFAMMTTLKKHGVMAPQDFTIVGYDATDLGAFCDPPLTTIDPRHQLLIEKAVKCLWSAKPKNTDRIRIEPELIVRASTQRAVKPIRQREGTPRK